LNKPVKTEGDNMVLYPLLNKDVITQSAIAELKAKGFRARKVHNVGAYRKRRNQVEPGWSDVQGYSRDGKALLCEIKTQGDKFSPEQIDRLDDLHQCGGVALVAVQKGLTVQLIDWLEYRKNNL
jgi:hypothetical protein